MHCLYVHRKGKSHFLLCFPGTEMAGNPSVRISLPTPNTELCPALRFGDLGPPPPYEETLKTS